jgi:hypothetical protein
MSDLSTEITSSSPLALGVGGTSIVKEEVPSKERRLMKQANSVKLNPAIGVLFELEFFEFFE